MKRLLMNCAAVALSAFLAIGCGDGTGDRADRKEKKQVITQKGSDTMVLLAQAWSEAFATGHPDIQIQVTGGGSGTGISSLINGTTDIANASRPMKEDERAQIKQKFGSDVVEIPVAKDGIAIYVHNQNPLDSISTAQLRDIYSGKITDWNQLGAPAGRIILYGRENSSGTYEFFKEHVLDKGDFAPTTQTLSGTAAIVNAVGKDAKGIGYGGEAYAQGVKVLKVSGASGPAVALSEETVRSGEYPISRDLYIYLRQQPAGATKTYVDWVLGAEGQGVVKKAGYFPIK